jgi:DNA-binding transcriptional ArsR family regulator
MSHGAFCPKQLAQALGVERKVVTKHLVYFRDSKLITVRTRRNAKYYGIRKETPHGRMLLVNLVIEMLEQDTSVRADIAIIGSLFQDHPHTVLSDEATAPCHFEGLSLGHAG